MSPESLAARRDEWAKVVKLWYRVVDYLKDPANKDEALKILVGARAAHARRRTSRSWTARYILTLDEALAVWNGGKDEGLKSLVGSDAVVDDFNVKYKIYEKPEAKPSYHDAEPHEGARSRERRGARVSARRVPWLAVHQDLGARRRAVLGVLAFVLPLAMWSAFSYVPFLWHPKVLVARRRATRTSAEGKRYEKEAFARRQRARRGAEGKAPARRRAREPGLPARAARGRARARDWASASRPRTRATRGSTRASSRACA